MTETQQFIIRLKKYRSILSSQYIKTLKGQALAGDILAAERGLNNLIKRGRNIDKLGKEKDTA